tara:strand:- start:241 stop:552 length:312 start_codon:yes stop_codon:yes gene_type:complete
MKGTCMICNELCEKPTFFLHSNLSLQDRDNIDLYNNNLNNYIAHDDDEHSQNFTPSERLYQHYINFIVNRLDNLPFDNENELKTIFFAGIFYISLYFLYIFYT